MPLAIDFDTVLVHRPVVAVSRAAPGLDERPVALELEHGGRRGRLLVLIHRTRSMIDPHVSVVGHVDRGHGPEDPVVRQRRPQRVNLELRHDRLGHWCRFGFWLWCGLTADCGDEQQHHHETG